LCSNGISNEDARESSRVLQSTQLVLLVVALTAVPPALDAVLFVLVLLWLLVVPHWLLSELPLLVLLLRLHLRSNM